MTYEILILKDTDEEVLVQWKDKDGVCGALQITKDSIEGYTIFADVSMKQILAILAAVCKESNKEDWKSNKEYKSLDYGG